MVIVVVVIVTLFPIATCVSVYCVRELLSYIPMSGSQSSTSSLGGIPHNRFISRKPKGFRHAWKTQYEPALYRSLVALSKDSNATTLPVGGLIIGAVQILAYCFSNIDW